MDIMEDNEYMGVDGGVAKVNAGRRESGKIAAHAS